LALKIASSRSISVALEAYVHDGASNRYDRTN